MAQRHDTSSAGAAASARATLISGAVSGVAATLAKQPIQRIKWIRQVHTAGELPYAQIVRETFARHGARGFFAGSVAALYRNVPHSQIT